MNASSQAELFLRKATLASRLSDCCAEADEETSWSHRLASM
jgi:hypothetical protein